MGDRVHLELRHGIRASKANAGGSIRVKATRLMKPGVLVERARQRDLKKPHLEVRSRYKVRDQEEGSLDLEEEEVDLIWREKVDLEDL
ncbi:hypothetical protein Scep_013932 [Stephania cephalantha]|uniref:Uncharacterized protein n=1 Tax=Stephania cephalantha TaxID=152367 RepID=A0AAP0J2U7_9MAGN